LSIDPLSAAGSAIQATAALALLFVLPGAALGPWLLPGAPTVLLAIGRAIAVSLLIVAGTCTLLAVLGLLRPPILLATLLGLTVLPLAVRVVRGRTAERGPAEDLRRPQATPSSRRRRVRAALGGALAGLFVAAVVLVPSIQAVGTGLLPQTSTPWYYMALARVVADTGGVPATIPEWGGQRPFPTDYVPATAHAAAALELLPGDLLTAVALYRLGLLAAGVPLAALLLRRWFSSWISVLGACLLFATVRLQAKFLDLRPETFALLIALVAIWATDRAIVERSRRAFAVALAAATLAFLSHAEVFLVLGPALVGLGVARGLPLRSGRLGVTLPISRAGVTAAIRPAGLALGVFIAAALLGAGLNGLLAGSFRLVGYVAADRGTTAAVPADRIPAGWQFSGDPTWDFYVASVAPAQVGHGPPTTFAGSSLLPRAILDIWPDLDGRTRADRIVLALLVLAPVLIWPWLDRRRRRFLVTWWVFGVALLIGSLALFLASSTYVPARVGPRRLMPYELIVPVISAVLLLFAADRLLRAGWRMLLPRRGAMLAAGVGLALLTIGAVAPAPGNAPIDEEGEPAGLSPVGLEALRWIDANLAPDARILTNAYTDGSMLAVAHRSAILDGRAVYLEHADFLAQSTSLLLGARVLFADPAGPRAAGYLASERVSHLLVATVGPDGSDLGGYLLFPTDLAALAGSGRYTPVRSFGGGRLLLLEVATPP
jgi:hypothetical protein